MRKGAVIPLSEIENRFLECLATRYMSQRELAGAYRSRFHLGERAFKYHVRRIVDATRDYDRPLTSLARYRIGREYYWCRSDDPRQVDLDLASKLGGRVRDAFSVCLPNLTLHPVVSGPGKRVRYLLRGYSSLAPFGQVWAVFYRITGDRRLEPIKHRQSGGQPQMRLAWLPADLWKAVGAGAKRRK